MNRVVSKCPVCGGGLHVTEVACAGCETRIGGKFESCRFCALPAEHVQFLELFLRSRGNISAVGDDLGVSFPTVSKRLDAALVALGLAESGFIPEVVVRAPERESNRAKILEMLDRGELTAEEATRRLKAI